MYFALMLTPLSCVLASRFRPANTLLEQIETIEAACIQ